MRGALAAVIALGALGVASPARIRRIGVIGGGIGGLSFARAVQCLDTGVEEVVVFDQRAELKPDLGGGVQLSGGAAVLADLGLFKELSGVAQPLRRVLSRTVSGQQLLELDVQEAIRRRPQAQSALTIDGQIATFTIMRDQLQTLLNDSLEPGTLRLGQRLVGVDSGGSRGSGGPGAKGKGAGGSGATTKGSGGAVTCHFEGPGGATESLDFDLVVAADGIGAACARLLGEERRAVYSGKRIQYGVAPEACRPEADFDTFHQWFGRGSYALAGSYGGLGGRTQHMVAHVFRGDSADENANWDASEVRGDCISRLEGAGMPDEVLRLADGAERFFELGVYFHLPRRSWALGDSRRVVLLGDAAHAMPPFLGQGANQAVQDAACLARRLREVNRGSVGLDEAIGSYQRRRQPAVSSLLAKSAFLGELETLPGDLSLLRDGFFLTTGALGIAERVFVDGTMPSL